jgi:hypothetical protein
MDHLQQNPCQENAPNFPCPSVGSLYHPLMPEPSHQPPQTVDLQGPTREEPHLQGRAAVKKRGVEVFGGERRDTQLSSKAAEELLHSSKLPDLVQLLALALGPFCNVVAHRHLRTRRQACKRARRRPSLPLAVLLLLLLLLL